MWLTAALSLGKVHCFFISPQYLPNCVRCCWSQQLVILSQTVLILWIDLCDTFSHRWSFSERMITLDVLLQHLLLTVVPSCSSRCGALLCFERRQQVFFHLIFFLVIFCQQTARQFIGNDQRVVESGSGSSSIIYLFAILTLETLASCSVLFYFFLASPRPKLAFFLPLLLLRK